MMGRAKASHTDNLDAPSPTPGPKKHRSRNTKGPNDADYMDKSQRGSNVGEGFHVLRGERDLNVRVKAFETG